MNDPEYFIEDFGLLFEKMGLTRMAGRVYGLLLLAQNERLSFQDIVDKLQASKSSISVTLKTLEQIGFIRSVSVPGDRKTYFSMLVPMNWMSLIDQKRLIFRMMIIHYKNALKFRNDSNDRTSKWLSETISFYEWLDKRMDGMMGEWEAYQEENKL